MATPTPTPTPTVSLAHTATVPTSGLPVGVSWVGAGEHLLFTSASQVILYNVHDGARVREWSFRPTKAQSFTLAVLAASAQGLLVGVQDRRRLVAWSDKGALTPVGGAGPEGLGCVEVPFAVAQLEVSAVGVAWCVGQQVPGQVACYSTAGETAASVALVAVASAAPPSEGATLSSCLAHPQKRVLLVVAGDGSLHLIRCAVPEGKTAGSVTTATMQSKLAAPQDEATLQSSGMMWSGAREDTAYVWTVWAAPGAGQLILRMGRVSFDQQNALSFLDLFTQTLSGSSGAASVVDAGSQKRRRASSSPAPVAGSPAVHTVGMAAEGLLVTAVEGEQGVRLQAWDAEFGVVVGEAVSSSCTADPSSLLVGGRGVMASASTSASSDVAVWRVEATDRPSTGDVGLRRVLGKLSSASAAASTMTFKSDREGWVAKDDRVEAVPGDTDDALEALLKLLPHEEEEHGKGTAADSKKKSGKKRKRSKDAAVFAQTLVPAHTALLVATLCLSTEAEDVASPAATPTQKNGKNSRGRKSNGNGSEDANRSKALWQLLQALLEAGKFPLRERPTLMLELLAKGRKDLVASVLAGPADVPEKAVVQAVSRLVRPSGEAKEQEQAAKEAAAKEAADLAGLAVRRPCCPAFLRAAMAAELDGPAAALLLVLLRALLERAMAKGAGTKPTEEQVLTWLEALLDAKFVSMVFEGTRLPAGAGAGTGEEGTGALLRQILGSVKDVARQAARACEALEVVDGYFSQFKRAGVHGIQVIPDYSLDAIVI